MKTFVASFKLHEEFLFKRETDGCFGWEKDQKKNAMTTQWQLFPAEGREQKASSSALAETFLPLGWSRKLVLMKRMRRTENKGLVPLLGGDGHRVERAVPTVEL